MRSKYAILNFIASFVRSGAGLLLGVVSTPIILGYLGEEQFAIFRILLDWFSHLTLLEFGLFGAILTFFSKILAEKRNKLGVALQVILKRYNVVLLSQILCLAIFAVFYRRLVPVSEEYAVAAWWSFAIMSVSTFFIYSQIFRAYLEASQKGYVVSYIVIAQNVMYLALAICAVYLSYGVVGQVVAYVVSLLFMLLIYLYLCRDMLPLFFSKEMLVQEDLNVFKKQRKNIFLNELFNRASFMSDNIIITFILGPKAVTGYYLTQRLAQILQQQVQNVGNAAWPALGELYYKNQKEILAARIVQLTEFTAAFSGICLGALVMTNKSFIYVWTGASTYSGDITTYLACINGGMFAVVSLWFWCLTAINRADKSVPVFFTQGLVNIIGSFVFTSTIGVNGPLIGTFLGLGMVTMWWLGKIMAETFAIRYRILMFLWIRPFVLPVGAAIAIHCSGILPRTETWIGFFASYAAYSLFFLTVVYFALVSKRTKDVFVEKFKEFILRKA